MTGQIKSQRPPQFLFPGVLRLAFLKHTNVLGNRRVEVSSDEKLKKLFNLPRAERIPPL